MDRCGHDDRLDLLSVVAKLKLFGVSARVLSID